jgi:hypothetical protein
MSIRMCILKMIAQHYQQVSPTEELADQLMKQGIATTKLDARKMAENMLNKQMHEAKQEEEVKKPVVENQTITQATPVQPSLQQSQSSEIHPHVQKHIDHIHSRIDEQHRIINELKEEIVSLKSRVSDHDEKFHKERNGEMATEIVEEPINYTQEHVQEEQQADVQQEVANEILEVETLTPQDKAEIAEAEEELSILPEKKKDDVDLLNIF